MESYTWIIYIAVIIGVFYFMMIRPEKKKKKAAEAMRNNLEVGDKITTIGGIIGNIVTIKADSIVLETSEDRVRIEVAKWGISTTGKATTEPK
jgi:preprotein translocase subunit YajC